MKKLCNWQIGLMNNYSKSLPNKTVVGYRGSLPFCIGIGWLVGVLFCFVSGATVVDAALPLVRVENAREVFDNGEHNAFTDLIRFRDRLYLTFRSCPDGHMVHGTSSIIVLVSDDGREWRQVYRFRVPNRDTRDPHFLEFQGRLFVYTGTWYSGPGKLPREKYEFNKHLGFGVWTHDGESWSEPVMLEGTYGHYIWRAAAFDGTAYLCGRRKANFAERPRAEVVVQSVMLESDDGLVWRKRALFQEQTGDETAFMFDAHGEVLAVSRRGREVAELLRSGPPYKVWTRTRLDEYIGGPLLVRWADGILVGGRRMTEQGHITTLYWLLDNQLHPCAELPSGGDNSYPGFVSMNDGKALLSWYSSHEQYPDGSRKTAIYLADLRLE